MLDERKLKVLYAIINSYVDSAEPIGSRTISKNFDLGVSSATIRNEMSDLEDLGYLSKPHSSAGRIPSDKGYRLYVDDLLQFKTSNLDSKMDEVLTKHLTSEINEMDELIKNAAKMLSDLTNYTSIVASPKIKGIDVEKIQLVPVENIGILILIICKNGLIKNSIVKVNSSLSSDDLNTISNYLNKKLSNLSTEEIINKLDNNIFVEKDNPYIYVIELLTPHIKSLLEELISVDLYSEGLINILNFPEYKDVEKAKEFMSFVDNKELLLDVLLKSSTSEDINIIIGDENIYSPIKDISIITATYRTDGKTIGKIGLIGPTRMDYLNLIKIVKVFSDNITEVINLMTNN